MSEIMYKRILLKISGEALAGDQHRGLDFDVINSVCRVIKKCVDLDVQMGIVIGAGNFWRGKRMALIRCSALMQMLWVCWVLS